MNDVSAHRFVPYNSAKKRQKQLSFVCVWCWCCSCCYCCCYCCVLLLFFLLKVLLALPKKQRASPHRRYVVCVHVWVPACGRARHTHTRTQTQKVASLAFFLENVLGTRANERQREAERERASAPMATLLVDSLSLSFLQ